MNISIECTAREFRELITGHTKIEIEPSENWPNEITGKVHVVELGSQDKKPRTKEQQADIDAIKEAYVKRTGRKIKDAAGEESKPSRAAGNHRELDDAYIVAEHDKGKSFYKLSKEMGICVQTIVNHYNTEKARMSENEQTERE